MLLSNLSSHASLLPSIAHVFIPIVPLPLSKQYPPYFFPATASSSSTMHPDYRDPAFIRPNQDVGQEDERESEGIRALVQAFEDGASEGVKEGKGKRKGECHFLASVFANISMVGFSLCGFHLMPFSFRRPDPFSSLLNHHSLSQHLLHRPRQMNPY